MAIIDSQLLTGTILGHSYRRENRSERDVEVPPAFMITDEAGGMWSFGPEYEVHNGQFEFNVIRNDVDTGEMASKIIYSVGIVTLYGRAGRRRWNGRAFI